MQLKRAAQCAFFLVCLVAAHTAALAQSSNSPIEVIAETDADPAAAIESAPDTDVEEGDPTDRVAKALHRSTLRLWRLIEIAPLLVAAVVVAWLAWRAGGWVSRRKVVTLGLQRNALLSDMLKHAVRGAFLLAGVMIALEIVGATSLAAALLGSAGVVGIALGFAFRDLLENYIASVLLSIRQPFRPDDFVMIDGHEGTIVGMNSRATILMTPEGNHLRLPNAQVFKSVILNYTRNSRRRFDFKLTLMPACDASCAMRLGLEKVSESRDILKEPAPFVQVKEAEPTGTVLQFFAWVDQASVDFFGARSEALRRTLDGLKEANFDLGPPGYRLDTRVHSTPGESASPGDQHQPPAKSGETHLAIKDAVDKTRDEMAERDLLSDDAPKE